MQPVSSAHPLTHELETGRKKGGGGGGKGKKKKKKKINVTALKLSVSPLFFIITRQNVCTVVSAAPCVRADSHKTKPHP